MGINPFNYAPIKDFICDKCYRHYLLEINSYENNILLKGFCFCGELTFQIEDENTLELLKEYQFYKSYKCKCNSIVENRKIISKFCDVCNVFLCKDCLETHQHKNSIIDPDLFLMNCKYHQNNKLIGLCKSCKKPLCELCINIFHKNHDIKFTKDLKITNEMIVKYENNLQKGLSDFDKLMKKKYSQEEQFLTDINYLTLINRKEKQIFICLEILKKILNLYYYHRKNGTLDFQLISNLIKHVNFEIIILPDKKIPINNKFMNFTSYPIDYIYKNINIDIYLKIDLTNEEEKKKENIIIREHLKIINSYKHIAKKLIKLKNGDLVLIFDNSSEFRIFENLIDKKYEIKDTIKDFIQLKNGNFATLSYNSETKRNNILFIIEEDKELKVGRIIQLDNTQYYYRMIEIDQNSLALLSYYPEENLSFVEILNYKNNKNEKIPLLTEISIGKIIRNKNKIIIVYSLKSLYKIFFYDIKNKMVNSFDIHLNSLLYNNLKDDENEINIFNIGKDKILISNEISGICINIKLMEIESNNKYLNNILCLSKINGYTIASFKDGLISQINIHTKEIYNRFKLIKKNEKIISIIGLENNQFCVLSSFNNIYLIKYK